MGAALFRNSTETPGNSLYGKKVSEHKTQYVNNYLQKKKEIQGLRGGRKKGRKNREKQASNFPHVVRSMEKGLGNHQEETGWAKQRENEKQ